MATSAVASPMPLCFFASSIWGQKVVASQRLASRDVIGRTNLPFAIAIVTACVETNIGAMANPQSMYVLFMILQRLLTVY